MASPWDGRGRPGSRLRNRTAALAVAYIAAGRPREAIDAVNSLVPYRPDEMMLLDFCHQVASLAHESIARREGVPSGEVMWTPDPEAVRRAKTAANRFGLEFVAAHTRGDFARAALLFRDELDVHYLAESFHGCAPSNDGIMSSVVSVVSTSGAIVRMMQP